LHANERAEIVLAQEGIEESGIRVLMIHESVARYGALVASSWAWTACSARVTAKIGLLGDPPSPAWRRSCDSRAADDEGVWLFRAN
jgi:hypothetical protein